MIDDGYTQEWNGLSFRPLTPRNQAKIRQLANGGCLDELESFLWKPPFVFADHELSDQEKNELLVLLMEQYSEDDAENLKDGVKFLLTNPLLAIRSCETCLAYWFNEETGLVVQHGDEPVMRTSHAKPACETDRGCAKGHHENPVQVLSEKNRQAWEHYLEWRHTGLTDAMRECPILRENWKIIGTLVEAHGIPKFYL